jgi:BlaI family transcriptional regulator, penicillinase repressor
MKTAKTKSPLGEREMDLLQAIWELGAMTAGEVQQHLALRGTSLAYNTVQTMLNRLEVKGYLRRSLDGRAYRYEPVMKQQAALKGTLQRVAFGGSQAALAAHLVESRLSNDELDHLQKLIDRARGTKR